MRVIAGFLKGRELKAPPGMHTRPTLAKVKEAMFGMIQFDVPGARVLDLFAGSGGLGIEAVSRGAESVVFCDSDRKAVSVIRENIARLGISDRVEVFMGDSLALLGSMKGRSFDIVLLDPPYNSELESKAIELLDEKSLLSDGAIIIAEHSFFNPPAFTENYSVRPARKYGDSYVTYAIYSRRMPE